MKKAFDANVPRAKVRYRMNFPPDFVDLRQGKDPVTVAVSSLATEARDLGKEFPANNPNGQKLASGAGMSDNDAVPHHLPGTTSSSRRGITERKSVLPEIPEPSDEEALSSGYSQVESGEEARPKAIERISLLERELSQLRTLDLSLEGTVQAARHQAERASDEALTRMDEARRVSVEMEEKARVLNDLSQELANLESQKDQVLVALDESHRALVESLAEEESTAKELAEILAGIRRLTSIIARLAAMPAHAPLPLPDPSNPRQ